MLLLAKVLFTVSAIGLLITSSCFAYVGYLRLSHDKAKSGSMSAGCVVVGHNIIPKGEKCEIIRVEQCPKGFYHDSVGVRPCVFSDIAELVAKVPLDSRTRRYYFKSEPSRYYQGSDLDAFAKKHERDPRTDYITLLAFFCVFLVSLIFNLGYISLRYIEKKDDSFIEQESDNTHSSDTESASETEMSEALPESMKEDGDESV